MYIEGIRAALFLWCRRRGGTADFNRGHIHSTQNWPYQGYHQKLTISGPDMLKSLIPSSGFQCLKSTKQVLLTVKNGGETPNTSWTPVQISNGGTWPVWVKFEFQILSFLCCATLDLNGASAVSVIYEIKSIEEIQYWSCHFFSSPFYWSNLFK